LRKPNVNKNSHTSIGADVSQTGSKSRKRIASADDKPDEEKSDKN